MASLDTPMKRETVRSQIEQYLRDAIADGTFRSGEKLIERDLCERLRISRPSLREALRTLEAEKLIVNIPHHGPMVRTMSLQEAVEIYALRILLESHAVGEFTRRASDAEIRQISDIGKRLRKAARLGAMDDYLRIKSEFYAVILDGCGNRLVKDTLNGLYARINFLRAASLERAGRLSKSIKEMEAIQECIERRDAAGAARKAGLHIQNAQKSIVDNDAESAAARLATQQRKRAKDK